MRDVFREFFMRCPDAIFLMSDDLIVDFNPAGVEFLGLSGREEVFAHYGRLGEDGLGLHPSLISPPRQKDGRDSYEKAMDMIAIALERGSHRFEWDHVRADGVVFPSEVLLTALGGDNRDLHVMVRDTSDRLALEVQVRRSERLETVGRLAGGIAHSINNMLVVIRCHAEILMTKIERGTPDPTHLSEIHEAVDRGAALTSKLLAFSRGQVILPRPTDMAEVVEELQAFIGVLVGAGISVEFWHAERPLTVEADPSQLEQVVMNLATNARDAMSDGGSLQIDVSAEIVTSDRPIGVLPPGEYVVLSMSDTGHGMDPDQIDRAFDPFVTSKPPGEGTGLGLATVQAIAEQNSGWARIESSPGFGTTVQVFLPRVAAAPIKAAGHSRPATEVAGHETILVVDDESAIRTILESALAEEGYRVLSAEDGAAALELATGFDQPIDMVLTDIVMPRLSGPELVDALMPTRPGLKVIFMSGYSERGARLGRLKDGTALLNKPFSTKELMAKIRRLLDAAS